METGIAGRSVKTKEDVKTHKAKYYQDHKEEKKLRDAKYREKHKEEIKKYYQEYKEEIKKYRAEHKEERNVRDKKYRKTPEGKARIARKDHKRRTKSFTVENTLTAAQFNKILKHQKGRCVMCNRKFSSHLIATRDHIVPLSKGGGLTFENVQALCGSCNSKKNNVLDHSKIVTWLHQPTAGTSE